MKYTGSIIKLISLCVVIISLAGYNVIAQGRAEEVEQAKQAAAERAAERAAALEAERQKQGQTEEPEAEPGKYKDGVYEGTGEGFGGDIRVSVTVNGGKITAIDVLAHDDEDDTYYELAEELLDDIISENDPQVDIVSGATFSSEGLIEAVGNALKGAENNG